MSAAGNGATLTTGQVGRSLGVTAAYVRKIAARQAIVPTEPARKQGSPARWTARDVDALRIALATNRAVAALAAQVEAAAPLLARSPGGLLAVGPRRAILTHRRRPVGKLVLQCGAPLIVASLPASDPQPPVAR